MTSIDCRQIRRRVSLERECINPQLAAASRARTLYYYSSRVTQIEALAADRRKNCATVSEQLSESTATEFPQLRDKTPLLYTGSARMT